MLFKEGFMQAYEFQTVTKDGFIQIPNDYNKIKNAKVKVIILSEENHGISKKSLFPDFTIDTEGYKFDRAEANER